MACWGGRGIEKKKEKEKEPPKSPKTKPNKKREKQVKTRDKERLGYFTSVFLSEETQNSKLKKYMHQYIHCSLIYSSQRVEATYMSIKKGINKKINGTYIQ